MTIFHYICLAWYAFCLFVGAFSIYSLIESWKLGRELNAEIRLQEQKLRRIRADRLALMIDGSTV